MGTKADDLAAATHVTTSDLKAAQRKLKAIVPTDGTALLLMLRRYANFIFALFTSESPLYKELAKVIRAFKKITLNARSNQPHKVRATILWIILLQSRVFAEGEMISTADSEDIRGCLGEFLNLKNALACKSLAYLTHEDMPDQLHKDPDAPKPGQSKRDIATMLDATSLTTTTTAPPNKQTKQQGLARHGYNKEMEQILGDAMKKAGNPSLYEMCKFCGVTRENLLPDVDCNVDCLKFCVLGKCDYGNRCKYNHLFASKKQLTTVKTKLQRFLDDPTALQPPGKQENRNR